MGFWDPNFSNELLVTDRFWKGGEHSVGGRCGKKEEESDNWEGVNNKLNPCMTLSKEKLKRRLDRGNH